jgi:hypothetical protein
MSFAQEMPESQVYTVVNNIRAFRNLLDRKGIILPFFHQAQ